MIMQVQAVVYNNELAALKKMAESFSNAAVYYNKHMDEQMKLRIILGEASPVQVVREKELDELRSVCGGNADIDYVNFGFNSGYGKGHNILSAHADADFLCIINPDIMVTAPFFCEMLAPFEKADTGITEGRQTPVEHPKEYDRVTKEVDWSSGACFIIRQDLFRELNGFDTETFFMYSEDVDLSWRVRNKGLKLLYCPTAPVFHAKRLGKNGRWNAAKTEVQYSALSQMLMAYKWGDEKKADYLCRQFKESPEKLHKRAAAIYEEKKEKGELPAQILEKNFTVNDRNRFIL